MGSLALLQPPPAPPPPSATYRSGRWPAWPAPGWPGPAAPAGRAAAGGRGPGRDRGWRRARGAGWAAAPGVPRARAEAGAGAGCGREPGRCLRTGERSGQSPGAGTARATPRPALTLCALLPARGPVQVADGLHGAQADRSGLAALGVPGLGRGSALGPSHAVCWERRRREPPGTPGGSGPLPGVAPAVMPARCRAGAGSQRRCPLGTGVWPQADECWLCYPAPALSSGQLAGPGGRDPSASLVGQERAPPPAAARQPGWDPAGSARAVPAPAHGLSRGTTSVCCLGCPDSDVGACGAGGPGARSVGGHIPRRVSWQPSPGKQLRWGGGKGVFFRGAGVFSSVFKCPSAAPVAEQDRVAPCPPARSRCRGQRGVAGQRGAGPLPSGWCVLPAQLAGVGAGGPQLVPRVPPDPPQGPALGWGLARGYPHHPCTRSPLAGGHSWLRSSGAGGCARQLPAPSPSPADHCPQPSNSPFFPGRASVPTAPVVEGSVWPPLPPPPHSPVPPALLRGARARAGPQPPPQPTFSSLPGHGSPCPAPGQ